MNPEEPPLHLTLRGPPTLKKGGQTLKCGVNALRLLAVLALDGPRTRLQLADLLWDTTTDHALHNLRMTLYQLRRTLGTDATLIHEEQGRLSLDLTKLHVDTHAPTGKNTEFMTGHRTGGSENWLEWAQEQDKISRVNFSCSPFSISNSFNSSITGKSLYQLRATPGAEHAARQVLQQTQHGYETALALCVLAYNAIDQGQYTRGCRYAEQALSITPLTSSEVAFTAAYANTFQGHHERVIAIAQDALKDLTPTDTPALLYSILGKSCDAQQKFHAARHYHELALSSAYEFDCPHTLAQVISFLQWHLNVTGNPDRAAQLGRQGLQYGAQNFHQHLMNPLGFSHLIAGQVEKALEVFSSQLLVKNVTLAANAHTCTALTLHRMGDKNAAQQLLSDGLLLTELTEHGGVKYAWATVALTIDAREWQEQALECTRNAVLNDEVIARWYAQVRERLIN